MDGKNPAPEPQSVLRDLPAARRPKRTAAPFARQRNRLQGFPSCAGAGAGIGGEQPVQHGGAGALKSAITMGRRIGRSAISGMPGEELFQTQPVFQERHQPGAHDRASERDAAALRLRWPRAETPSGLRNEDRRSHYAPTRRCASASSESSASGGCGGAAVMRL